MHFLSISSVIFPSRNGIKIPRKKNRSIRNTIWKVQAHFVSPTFLTVVTVQVDCWSPICKLVLVLTDFVPKNFIHLTFHWIPSGETLVVNKVIDFITLVVHLFCQVSVKQSDKYTVTFRSPNQIRESQQVSECGVVGRCFKQNHCFMENCDERRIKENRR